MVEGPGKKLILMQDTMGHAPYRHHPSFTQFDEQNDPNNINKYDNSLLQTDDLLSRIIGQLQHKNAVFLYCSDHGESFGEQGCYMHAGLLDIEKQRHVFAFAWYSDEYGRRHPDIVHNLEANRKKPLSQDHIYHTIISLCGIRSAVQDPHLDMTQPLSQPDATSFSLDEF